MAGTFGQKPTDSHVVWTNRAGERKGKKRFDFDYLERWASHVGIDYETRRRVDHDRSETPREQHLIVFEWATVKNRTLEMGDSTWEFGGNETPRTFVEIDEAGIARMKSWEREVIIDLRELWIDGPRLRMKTADQEQKVLDTRKLIDSDDETET